MGGRLLGLLHRLFGGWRLSLAWSSLLKTFFFIVDVEAVCDVDEGNDNICVCKFFVLFFVCFLFGFARVIIW